MQKKKSQLAICIPIYFLVNYSVFLRFYDSIFLISFFFFATSVVTRYWFMIGNRKHEGGEVKVTLAEYFKKIAGPRWLYLEYDNSLMFLH
jgi:hypothetical protein